MVLNKVDKREWRKEFKRRFSNFAENCPLIIYYEYDDVKLHVVDEKIGLDVIYQFDYTLTVSDFIHAVKEDLLPYYPVISRKVETLRKISNTEVVDLLMKGKSISEIPEEVVDVRTERYRVDKYIAAKNMYFITLLPDGSTEKFVIKPFGMFFIKNYREGKYNNSLEAGDAFFKRAESADGRTSNN